MATKKRKAEKRKPRTWTREARISLRTGELSVIHPEVPLESVKRLHGLIGDDGEYVRVRITEVIK